MFRVLHHDHCFDGACSAAVFTSFHKQCIGGESAYEYRGLQHAPGGAISDAVFGLEGNAIVDFKYTPSPKLTWWFDHHASAFLTPSDRACFEAGQHGALSRRQFFDPDSVSCTGLIAKVATELFGFDPSGLDDLLRWADIIDGARYESAKAAVEMKAPALQVALVIENAPTPDIIPRVIPLLTQMSLEEVLAQPFVQQSVAPLVLKHQAAMQLVQQRAELRDGVIFFDLTDKSIDSLSKFIPYYFYPDATYTIAVTRSSTRVKISVGTNPWTKIPVPRLENLAAICERYGGGGHARVGAISFPPEQIEKAQAAAAVIAEQLRQEN